MEMLEAGQESGELKEEGKKMITGVFAFDDILAYEIMTPRTDVFAIDINDEPSEYIDELMSLKYSRIPVYEDDSDNIIGILNIKDYLIQARELGFDNVDIRAILRTPYFVPETKNIDSLFVELQKTKQHIAILIDEYGGFSGIVTMEDIIEEVMGEIDDEYDEEEPEIKQIRSDTWQLDGSRRAEHRSGVGEQRDHRWFPDRHPGRDPGRRRPEPADHSRELCLYDPVRQRPPDRTRHSADPAEGNSGGGREREGMIPV